MLHSIGLSLLFGAIAASLLIFVIWFFTSFVYWDWSIDISGMGVRMFIAMWMVLSILTSISFLIR